MVDGAVLKLPDVQYERPELGPAQQSLGVVRVPLHAGTMLYGLLSQAAQSAAAPIKRRAPAPTEA